MKKKTRVKHYKKIALALEGNQVRLVFFKDFNSLSVIVAENLRMAFSSS